MRGVPRRAFVFDPPDRFVAGTVGEPGSRTFFLQAREGTRVVSVVLEKTQVAVLAERLGSLLLELDQRGLAELAEVKLPDDVAPLDEPLNEAFRAGTLTLGWGGERRGGRTRRPGPPPRWAATRSPPRGTSAPAGTASTSTEPGVPASAGASPIRV